MHKKEKDNLTDSKHLQDLDLWEKHSSDEKANDFGK